MEEWSQGSVLFFISIWICYIAGASTWSNVFGFSVPLRLFSYLPILALWMNLSNNSDLSLRKPECLLNNLCLITQLDKNVAK